MRTLITGGYGFVGQALARRLTALGHDVVLLARRARLGPVEAGEATGVVADLRDPVAVGRVLTDGEFDGVVHLAALTRVRDSIADPLGYFETNLAGTGHLLAAMDDVARKYSEVIGLWHQKENA